MKHVVGLSGGKDSCCLALMLREREPRDYEYICTPVGNELPEMTAHWSRMETLLGAPIKRIHAFDPATVPDGLLHLIRQWQALPNHRQRWCTRMLKIVPTIAHLVACSPCVQYVGLRSDEETREGIYGTIPGVEQRYPLREWGMDERAVWAYLGERGVTIPSRTDCAWCYGQRIGEWWRLLRDYPDLYAQAEQIEQEVGRTFRSAQRDTWPAGLAELRTAFAERLPRGESRERMPLALVDENEQRPCRVCSL